MGYKRETIIKECEERLKDPGTFYKKDLPMPGGEPKKRKDIINYRGVCTDTKEYYTEVIAEFLCDHIDAFKKGIKKAERREYNVGGHDCKKMNTDRKEEGIAMKMRKYSEDGGKYDFIGEILDYQVPLKSNLDDAGFGKIDLLAYDEKTNTMRILELKKPDSKETMLRCVLEGYTYLETIKNKKKFITDFKRPEDASLKASPFVFADPKAILTLKFSRKGRSLKNLWSFLTANHIT